MNFVYLGSSSCFSSLNNSSSIEQSGKIVLWFWKKKYIANILGINNPNRGKEIGKGEGKIDEGKGHFFIFPDPDLIHANVYDQQVELEIVQNR